MNELIHILFHPVANGVMSILMIFNLVYWVFQLLMGGGVDLGTDSEVHLGDISDVGAESGVDTTEAEPAAEPSFFSKALEFINIGKVPLMVIVTLFKFLSWVITIMSTITLGLGKLGAWSLVILIPVFLFVFFLMHWITKPLVRLFHKVGYQGEESIDFIGRVGVMKSSIEGDKIGSAEIRIDQDVYTLNIKSADGFKLSFGDHIIITDEVPSNHVFMAIKHLSLQSI